MGSHETTIKCTTGHLHRKTLVRSFVSLELFDRPGQGKSNLIAIINEVIKISLKFETWVGWNGRLWSYQLLFINLNCREFLLSLSCPHNFLGQQSNCSSFFSEWIQTITLSWPGTTYSLNCWSDIQHCGLRNKSLRVFSHNRLEPQVMKTRCRASSRNSCWNYENWRRASWGVLCRLELLVILLCRLKLLISSRFWSFCEKTLQTIARQLNMKIYFKNQ